MKITGGNFKGKSISAGAASGVRPTAAKVRQALFNILGEAVEGAVFLDLYAGSGTVGAEALSRGATKAVFVDSDSANIKALRTLEKTWGAAPDVPSIPDIPDVRDVPSIPDIPDISGVRVRVIQSDAALALKQLALEGERFNIVFVDPPYGSSELELSLPILGRGETLATGAVVVVEHFYKKHTAESAGALKLRKRYRYGDTVLSLYEMGG